MQTFFKVFCTAIYIKRRQKAHGQLRLLTRTGPLDHGPARALRGRQIDAGNRRILQQIGGNRPARILSMERGMLMPGPVQHVRNFGATQIA